MRLTLTALILVGLMVAAVAASAEVIIGSPTDGSTVGPNTPIYGRCSERAFLVITTDCMDADGEKIGMVPGIRHWTNDDNSISVRISTPRVSFGDRQQPVTYVIHVKAYSSPAAAQAGEMPSVGEAQVSVKSE